MADHGDSRHGKAIPEDHSVFEKALSPRHIGAFSRKITSTASHLIGNPINNSHYHNAMTELNHGLRGPALQRSLFAYARASPTELLRSKLSSQEIRHRALAFIPDETLAHIPEDESEFSLFRGFEATVLTDQHDRYGTESKRREAAGVVQEIPGADETSSSIRAAQGERHELNNTLETLGVRKEICSIEIREIDKRIADMVNKRKIVLHRLEALEVKEMEMTRDLQDADSKLEDLLDEAANAGDGSNAALSPQNPVSNPDAQSDSTEEGNSFMSASIYGKLPSPKSRRRKPAPRRSTTIRHELLDPGTSILNFQAHTDSLAALDFDVPYGTMVTSALDDTVRVWDLNLGRCVGLLEGHQASVRCLQVDEQRVATGSMDASIRLWDLGQVDSQTHRTLGDAAETEGAPSVAPLPPNSTANCHILTLTAHVAEITAIHFHANMLVSGSADKTLRQWDLVKGRCVQTLDVLWAAAQASAANSPLARSLSEEKEQSSARPIWQNSSMRQADSPSSFVGALQCFDAALACGTADGMVRLWDLRSGQVNRSLVGHTGAVTSLQFDDRKMVTGSADRSIRIWDLRTGSIIDAYAYERAVTSMMFDQRRIVAAAGESVAKVYDQADGRHWDCGPEPDVASGHVGCVRVKDGYLVEGRTNGIVGVWSC